MFPLKTVIFHSYVKLPEGNIWVSVTNPKDVTAGVKSLVLHPRDDTQLSHQSGQQHSNILHRCLATNLEDAYAAKNNSLDVFERKDVQLPQNMVINVYHSSSPRLS